MELKGDCVQLVDAKAEGREEETEREAECETE